MFLLCAAGSAEPQKSSVNVDRLWLPSLCSLHLTIPPVGNFVFSKSLVFYSKWSRINVTRFQRFWWSHDFQVWFLHFISKGYVKGQDSTERENTFLISKNLKYKERIKRNRGSQQFLFPAVFKMVNIVLWKKIQMPVFDTTSAANPLTIRFYKKKTHPFVKSIKGNGIFS